MRNQFIFVFPPFFSRMYDQQTESPRILNRKYCYDEHSNGYLGDITWAQATVGRHLRNLSSLFDTLSGVSRHIYEYPPRIVGSYPQLLQRHSSLLNSH